MKKFDLRKLAFALLFVFGLLLVGCDNNNDTGAQTSGAGTDPTPIEFRFAWWGGDVRHESTNAIIELYMSENPHVTIIPEFGPWTGFQDATAISLEGGVEADLMQVNYNWISLYSPLGTTFLDMETVADYIDLDGWDPAFLDFMRSNDVLQGVPTGITAQIPVFQTAVFEAAGITELPRTFDDLFAVAEQFQDILGEGYFPLAHSSVPAISYIMFSYLEQVTGKQFVDENNQFNYTLEEVIRGLQLIRDMVDAGVLPAAYVDSDPAGSTNPAWINGYYATFTAWDSAITDIITNLPTGTELEVGNVFQVENPQLSGIMARPSMGFSISRNTEHPEEVARFLNFLLTDPRAVEIQGTDRGVPSNQTAFRTFEDLGFSDLVFYANEMIRTSEFTKMTPIWENPSVRGIYEAVVEAIMHNAMTPEEGAQQILDRTQPTINQELDL